jgi:hypothetical protein
VGTVHTNRQLCDVSVLALLKTDISAHPGRAGRPAEEPHDRPQTAAVPVITTARERVINHALGTTWPSYAAI